jgi:dihydroorotate dehydrogenase
LFAGFDKDAKLYKELSNFGFGFIEIGTLTPKDKKETLKAIVSIKKIRQLLTEWVLIMVEKR